ncbi:hypothetical protein C1646_668928 [Rhizophagus diaphanus]|nr:hypothetical protein C1646_668928 [Rhizophagus diaphanus] [Rhizophagus sp. MUCL 43196]
MHGKTHTGFGPTAQFVRNVGIVIECCECNKWCVLYSKTNSSIEMENVGDEYSESDDVGNIFENVKVDDKLMCSNPMELSYYPNGLFEDICFQCGKYQKMNLMNLIELA